MIGPSERTIDLRLAGIAALYPTPAKEPGDADDAEQWIADALESDDSYKSIKLIDQALEILGPNADALLIRATAFHATGQKMWWLFDVEEALALRAKEKSRFADHLWQQAKEKMDQVAATLPADVIADFREKRAANAYYNRGYRALQRSDGKTAMHWFCKSLSVRPLALALWYGAFVLVSDESWANALWALDKLALSPDDERKHLFAFVKEDAVKDAHAALKDVVEKKADPAPVVAAVKRAMGMR